MSLFPSCRSLLVVSSLLYTTMHCNAAPSRNEQCAVETYRKESCEPCSESAVCRVLAQVSATTPEECCGLCAQRRNCAAWTFNANEDHSKQCHLKTMATPGRRGNCTSGSRGGAGPTNTSRPNILFLMCDSMDGRVLDPTSPVHRRLRMPNLRALAARGANFIRTYAASPQCVPSRTTMFTGRHIHQTKTWNNGQGVASIPSVLGGLDAACVTFYGEDTCRQWRAQQNISATLLDTLRNVGYESHLYGKVDVGAGIMQDSDEVNATCSGFHSGPALSILTRTADIRRATKPDPLKITNDLDNHVHEEDWKMLPKCIEFLERQSAMDVRETTNWMLYCSINIPHPAFDTNATWLKLVNDDQVNVPTWLPEDAFHPADSYMSQSKAVWRNFSDAEILKVRKTYYAMCAETDYMLGLVLDALRRTGLEDDTFIVFLSDHGEMAMEHRQVWKNSMYEASSRVPLIIVPPANFRSTNGGEWERGITVSNLTSLLDVFPTLLDMAKATRIGDIADNSGNVRMPEFLDGYSLFPFLSKPDIVNDFVRGKAYPNNRSVVSQYHSNMGNTGSFMIRSGPWKYIAFGRATYDPTYTPQLFNVEEDPEELDDVANKYPHIVAELDAMLRSVVDYPNVDAEVRAQDVALYKKYFVDRMDVATLRRHFGMSYTGFDDRDWQKIQSWVHNTSSPSML